MNYKAHITIGTLTGVGVSIAACHYQYHLSPVLITVPAMIGSVLPDIDHPKSYLGRRLPFISKPLFHAFGHRTITHSLLFLCIITASLMKTNTSVGIGIFFGILSHLLADMLTPFSKGVALFYPVRKRFGLFMAKSK